MKTYKKHLQAVLAVFVLLFVLPVGIVTAQTENTKAQTEELEEIVDFLKSPKKNFVLGLFCLYAHCRGRRAFINCPRNLSYCLDFKLISHTRTEFFNCKSVSCNLL